MNATWWCVNRTSLLAHGPVMVYDRVAKHSLEGALPDARGTKVHARGANAAMAKMVMKKAANGKKEAVDAPTAATNFTNKHGSHASVALWNICRGVVIFFRAFYFNWYLGHSD